MVRSNDNASKCIDLILLNFDFTEENPTIMFNLIDITKSANRTLKKITNFLESSVFSQIWTKMKKLFNLKMVVW